MNASIVWHLGDTVEPCENCIDLDGQSFSPDDIPGYPGDGGFGQDTLCLAGPNCGCEIELFYDDQSQAQTEESLGRQIGMGEAPAADLGRSVAPKRFLTVDEAKEAYERRLDWHNSDGLSPDGNPVQIRSHLWEDHQFDWALPDDRDQLDRIHAADHNESGECGAHEKAVKDFSVGSPLGSGFVPFDLASGVQRVYPSPLKDREVVERFDSEEAAKRALEALYDPAEYEVVGNVARARRVWQRH